MAKSEKLTNQVATSRSGQPRPRNARRVEQASRAHMQCERAARPIARRTGPLLTRSAVHGVLASLDFEEVDNQAFIAMKCGALSSWRAKGVGN